MIDYHKNSIYSIIGKQAATMPEVLFASTCSKSAPEIVEKAKGIRTKVKSGEMKIIENSNEYYL